MRSAAFAALTLCLGSAVAIAQPAATPPGPSDIVNHVETVRELAAVCHPAWGGVPRLEAIAYCQGYLTSAGQHHMLLHGQPGRLKPLYCLPVPGPTIAESGLAFAAWARANPAYTNEPALDGFLRWAQASFPCPTAPAPAPAHHARRPSR